MRAHRILALSASFLLSGCATSTHPLMPQIPQIRPDACMTACPALPRLDSDDEIGVTVWTLELIDVAGQCRRQHEACRSAR